MDQTVDLSARVLLKHILWTEPPRTPVTRSESQASTSSELRRSSRLSRKSVEPQTPQDMLRRSLKHKMRESIIRKSQPATKRRTVSAVAKKTPADALMHFNEEDTPRHLLKKILQTEPAKSPVVHEKGDPEEPQVPSADKTDTSRTHSSIELSGLDLPDVTIGVAASTSKGLSRKRPRRSLNITAFEKRLRDGNDAEEDADISTGDHSSLSLSSSTSLSLKTPFADVRTEKRVLQRKVSNRRKITEEEFSAAVSKRQTGDVSSHDLGQKNLDVTNSEGFTLGLSKLSMPDITTDILNCNTALYDQPDATTFNLSTVATQDKPTVMASQLLREMDRQQEEEQSEMEKDGSHTVSPSKEDECISTEAELQNEEGQNQPDDAHDVVVGSEFEDEQNVVEAKADEPDDEAEPEQMEAQTRTEDEGATDSLSDEDGQGHLGLKKVASSASETAEEHATDSPPEAAEKGSYSEEEKVGPDSQMKEEGIAETEEPTEDSQSEDAEERSQSDEVPGSAPSADAAEAGSQSEDVAESQAEDDYNNEQRGDDEEEEEDDEGQTLEQLERGLEFISRRAHRSEGAIIPSATRWTNGKSKAHSALGLNTSADSGSHDSSQPGKEDLAKPLVQDQHGVSCSGGAPGAGEDNLFDLLGVTQDIEVSRHRSIPSPEVVPAQDDADQDEESQEEDMDEEVEEFPCDTPAFVREKRKFLPANPPASVLENIQASGPSEVVPAAKPKQTRRRKTGTTKKPAVFSKTYLMSVFRHFAKTKVSPDVYPVLNEILDKFFDRMVEDLETYAAHAKRKSIEVEDAILLLRRQGYVNDKVPVEVLIEKFLRMEQRKLLIPIATSGNVVIPKTRR